MPFQPVYLSQQDPQWKNDLLGFGDPGDTIGYLGCALTSVAMLLSGHGYAETPKSLNQKLKNVNGFVSAGIRWGAVSQLYPNLTLKAFIPCATSEAPLAQIDAALAAGQPAIVQVDNSPADGIQTHWVVLYGKRGDDYLMLDPWPYQPDVSREDLLMKRYAHGRNLKRAISHVILYDAYRTTPAPPDADPGSTSGTHARVKDSVTWGLNLRSSVNTSSMANVVAVVPAGTQLVLLEQDGPARIGAVNQWVRVRTPLGKEGFVAAWYLENAAAVPSPSPTVEPVPVPVSEPPTPATPLPPVETPKEEEKDERLVVVVSSAVGTSGLRLRKTPSKGGALITVLKAGTPLTVLEPTGRARKKVGRVNQWLHVRGPANQRGYVSAEYVALG
jgi:hypothetical protein